MKEPLLALAINAALLLAGCGAGSTHPGEQTEGGTPGTGASSSAGSESGSGGAPTTGGQSPVGGWTSGGRQGTSSGGSAPTGGGAGTAGDTPETGGQHATGGATEAGGRVGSGGRFGSGGRTSSGGQSASGGISGSGGGIAATGGLGVGGTTGTGGRSGAGGTPVTGGRSGAGGTPATGGSTNEGGGGPGGKIFSQCRFHFGTIDSVAKAAGPSMISELDFFTPGWMGQSDSFDMGYVCDEGKAGGVLGNQVPVIVAYVAAFYAKRHAGLQDCNVGTPSLCEKGAEVIQQNLTAIVNTYKSYAQGFASCYATVRPIVFEMEPDWYQYTISQQSKPMTAQQAGSIMGQFADAIKSALPNAFLSMDVSPWVNPNNGSDNGQQWYSNFSMGAFTFMNTSGGGTNANTTSIRSGNAMTWAGLNQVTGKPILADTGYGANGSSAGHDQNWDVVANINARIADGVIAIAQYNPSSNWGSTISSIRSQLNTPRYCP
jgi:hypothetical protein